MSIYFHVFQEVHTTHCYNFYENSLYHGAHLFLLSLKYLTSCMRENVNDKDFYFLVLNEV